MTYTINLIQYHKRVYSFHANSNFDLIHWLLYPLIIGKWSSGIKATTSLLFKYMYHHHSTRVCLYATNWAHRFQQHFWRWIRILLLRALQNISIQNWNSNVWKYSMLIRHMQGGKWKLNCFSGKSNDANINKLIIYYKHTNDKIYCYSRAIRNSQWQTPFGRSLRKTEKNFAFDMHRRSINGKLVLFKISIGIIWLQTRNLCYVLRFQWISSLLLIFSFIFIWNFITCILCLIWMRRKPHWSNIGCGDKMINNLILSWPWIQWWKMCGCVRKYYIFQNPLCRSISRADNYTSVYFHVHYVLWPFDFTNSFRDYKIKLSNGIIKWNQNDEQFNAQCI